MFPDQQHLQLVAHTVDRHDGAVLTRVSSLSSGEASISANVAGDGTRDAWRRHFANANRAL
jgi:hypothetical protein